MRSAEHLRPKRFTSDRLIRRMRAADSPSNSSVWDLPNFPPNHHADAHPVAGVVGYVSGFTMMIGRKRNAQLAASITGIDPTDRVVDVGCGPGVAVRVAERQGAPAVGVDPSPSMIRLARVLTASRGRSRRIGWLQACAERIALPDGSTTVCWSIASVHHWSDLCAGIAEVHRILEPGGRFVAIERRTRATAKGRASHGWTPAQAARFAQILRTSGFTDVHAVNHDLGQRGVVAVLGTKPPDQSDDRRARQQP